MKWLILWELIQGRKMKEIAKELKVSHNYIRKIKYRFPLFFWREKKRYIK